MSNTREKGPRWSLDVYSHAAEGSHDPKQVFDFQFSPDLSVLELRRTLANGQVYRCFLHVENVADISRVFASDLIARLAVHANTNYRRAGLDTTLADPVTFDENGQIVSEILLKGEIYRRVVFDPVLGNLSIDVEGQTFTASLDDVSHLPFELARILGVTLPLEGMD